MKSNRVPGNQQKPQTINYMRTEKSTIEKNQGSNSISNKNKTKQQVLRNKQTTIRELGRALAQKTRLKP